MINDISKGFGAYFTAFQLLNKLKLWKYFLTPMFISVAVGIGIMFAAYMFSSTIGNYIADFWWFEWGKETIRTISYFIGGFVIIAFGIVIFKHLIMGLSAPFMGPVSEKIERYLVGSIPKKNKGLRAQASTLSRGLRLNIRNLIRELLLVIFLLIIGLIPAIGITTTMLIFIVQSYYAGFGNMDYTLERHLSYRESIKFVRKRRGIAIGNGIGFMLILLIPFLGILLVLPLSVVAATTETVKELHPIETQQLRKL